MGRLGVVLVLAVGIFGTSVYGFELSSVKELFSQVISKTSGLQKQTPYDYTLDLPDNAHFIAEDETTNYCNHDGMVPMAGSCTVGMNCDGGHIANFFECDGGLHFNNFTKRCEDLCAAHCDPALACECGWDTCQNSLTEADLEKNWKKNQNSFVEKQNENYPATNMPDNAHIIGINDLFHIWYQDGLKPHSNNCSMGIIFNDYNYQLFVCDDGLHFNNYTKKCEDFCSAHCDPALACKCGWDVCENSTKLIATEESAMGDLVEDKSKISAFCRRGRDGKFADPDNCSMYILCYHGLAVTEMCPYGQHFNKKTKQCDTPCNAKCDPTICGLQKQTPYDFTLDLPNNAHLIDEDENTNYCNEDGFLPIAGSCTVGMNCDGRRITNFFECDGGLHFNNFTKRCEDLCAAHCDPALACECGWDTCQNSLTEADLEKNWKMNQNSFVEKQKEDDPILNMPNNAHIIGLDGLFDAWYRDGLKPISNNCSMGMIFNNFNYQTFVCDDGLHFNNYTKKCEDFCSAHCDPALACKCGWDVCETCRRKSSQIDLMENQVQYSFDSDLPKNARFIYEASSRYLCLRTGIFAFPGSCVISMSCKDTYVMNFFECDEGFHFNNVTKECEDFCSARCDPALACECGWDTCEIPTEKPDESFNCPKNGLFPHPKNCDQYIQCSNSVAYTMSCPSGLHFSSKTKRCESPCIAKCDPTLDCNRKLSQTNFEEEKWIPLDLGAPKNAHVIHVDNFYSILNADDVKSHFNNCSLGMIWKGGDFRIFMCDDSLHFNNLTKKCEETCTAHCDPDLACECEWSTCKKEPTCHKDGLFPHPKNCNQYIHCSNGNKYTMTCPSRLHFSKETKQCEHPCDAKCDPTLSCRRKLSQIDRMENQVQYSFDSDLPKNARFIYEASTRNLCLRTGRFIFPGSCVVAMDCEGMSVMEYYKCNDGFHFNNITKECEDFCSARCDPALACECGWDTCDTPTEKPDESFKCPKNGLFPHPKNCDQYIQCSNSVAYTMPCPSGLHFSSKTKRCESPCIAKCDPTLDCDRKLSQTNFEEKIWIPYDWDKPKNAHVIQVDNFYSILNADDVKSHFNNCSLGMIWKGGDFRIFMCDDSLHFNNLTKKCEETCSAHCDPDLACECEWSTCKKEPTCHKNGLYPHPKNCNQYIHCSNGQKYTMTCPSGLHFSIEKKQCENPCDAKCDPTLSCKRKSNQMAETPISSEIETPELTESLKKVFTLTLRFVCFEDGVFPNMNDCNKYINCSNGISYDLSCPFNLHFNSETGRCEPPCFANCDPTLPCKWRTFKKTVAKETLQTICSEDGVYTERNPLDCKSYFRCENGDGVLFYCDEGQHFNRDTLRCEEPCNARCDLSMAEKCGWEDTLENASSLRQPIFDFTCPGDGLYENQYACENFIQCTGGDAYLVNCPYGLHYSVSTQRCTTPCEAQCDPNYEKFCKDEGIHHSPKQILKDFDCQTEDYYANPFDCETFIQCFSGTAYTISCPLGLHYSPTLGICMTPCEAKCSPDYDANCGQEEKSLILWPRQHSRKQPSMLSEFTCPLENGVHPNPEACTSYIECMMGQHIIRYCPDGLHFSTKTEKCELPCDAYCDSSIGDRCGWDYSWFSIDSPKDSALGSIMVLSTDSPNHMYHVKCMLDGIYKDPNDCSQFIQCVNQHPYTMQCPEGLHYNEESHQCDRPCDAHCNVTLACECGWEACNDEMESTYEVYCEAKPNIGPCPERFLRYYYDVESGRCRSFDYGGCGGNRNNFKTMEECENKCQKTLLNGFKCPFDSGKFGNYPDCISYYHCKMGIPLLKRCPRGTAFDHLKAKCVTEYEANCLYQCRDKDAVYPYEKDCRKYIDCVNGISKLERCPHGKAFDPVEKDCIEERLVSTCF